MDLSSKRSRLEELVRRANTVPEGLRDPVPATTYRIDVTQTLIVNRVLNLDRAQVLQMQAVVLGTHDVFRKMALQADETLRRIAAGTYGTCAACGEPISEKRIDAAPWSPLCAACQELAGRHELLDFEYLAN